MSRMKTVVVTGGTGGIGRAAAVLFAARGWRVIVADRDAADAEAVAAALRRDGAEASGHGFDVTDEAAVEAFAGRVIDTHGSIDALVESAGLLENAVRLTRMPMAEYDAIMDVNLRGAVLLTRAFGRAMCDAGSGAIVHLCSMTSIRPSGQPAYAVSKAGLKMLTEISAAEFGPHGVRVNAVAPGYTLTPALKARIDRGERDPQQVLAFSALKRFVEPEDVAEAIWFLCSDAARSITGVMLPIDCGWLVRAAYGAYAAVPD